MPNFLQKYESRFTYRMIRYQTPFQLFGQQIFSTQYLSAIRAFLTDKSARARFRKCNGRAYRSATGLSVNRRARVTLSSKYAYTGLHRIGACTRYREVGRVTEFTI